MAKINVNGFVDLNSVLSVYKDEVGVNGAVAPETARAVAREVFSYVPEDVTVFDTGISTDNTGGVANYISSIRETVNGEYQETGTSSNTKGIITVGGSSKPLKVVGYNAISNFSDFDVEQASAEGRSIRSLLYQAHSIKYFNKLDEVFYNSVDKQGFKVDNAKKDWKNSTDEEISIEFREFLLAQLVGTNGAYSANVLLMPKYHALRLHASDHKESSDLSMWDRVKMFLMDYGYQAPKIVASDKLTDRITFLSNNQNASKIRIPRKLKFSKVHKIGFQNSFEGMFRVAGLDTANSKVGRQLKGV
jgi:hypothetical protein